MRMIDLFESVHNANPDMEKPALHDIFHVEKLESSYENIILDTVWRELSEEEAKENLQYARLRFKDETTEEMLQDYVKALGLDYIDDTNTPYELYDLIREATSLKVAFMPVIYLC